jgi:hypothetical protein
MHKLAGNIAPYLEAAITRHSARFRQSWKVSGKHWANKYDEYCDSTRSAPL